MKIAPLDDNDYDIPSSFPQAKETRGREIVWARHSHAPHHQTISTAPTWVTESRGLPIRFPSDRMIMPRGGTVTKDEYEDFWERLSEAS